MNHRSFSQKDLEQFRQKKISPELIQIQLENFRKGFPPVSLVAPAVEGDGIIRLTEEEVDRYAESYRKIQPDLGIIKFVPASGAASRMFKSLFEYLQKEEKTGDISEIPTDLEELFTGIRELALWEDLERLAGKEGLLPLDPGTSSGKLRNIVRLLVGEGGLNYGQLPKGLIKFHKYPEGSRTPLEEHMVEGVEYARGKGDRVQLHFTVSPEHLEGFRELLGLKRQALERRFGVGYSVDFSLQRQYTDVIAVDPDNRPFREADGSVLFRPGGHGALLANMNELEADLIFIKNIDNVCPDRMKPATYTYKRALAGLLLAHREKASRYLGKLAEGDLAGLDEIEHFLEKKLNTRLSEQDKKLEGDQKAALLREKLDRPIRVCGMVRNEGEPGGGPFWCHNRDGSVSLQIVESAQINFQDPGQAGIASSASHFNPVDLVCATRDFKGGKYELSDYVDPDTGLISEKSRDGRKLKAQELPGLWNGSMAGWNTLFVEVPIETFTPVKTINDLLRQEHRT